MSVDFSEIEGGSVAAFLSGDGSLPTPGVEAAPEQAPAEGADSHQVEIDPATSQTDATIETDESKPDAALEGSEESSEQSDSPDTQQPKEEFKGPKELRTAYETLKAEVAPLEPYKDFIKTAVENEISPVMLQEGKALLDSFLSLESAGEGEEVNASPFLSALYQLSPDAFNRAMMTLVDDNKDFITKRLGIEAKTEADASSSVGDEDIPVPDFDPETGEPLSDELKAFIKSNIEKVREFNAKEKARTETERAAAAAQAEKEAEEQNARVEAAITSYREERMKVIDTTIEKSLGLQELPTDKPEVKADKAMLRDIIKGATVSSFGNDAKARELYKNAVDKIAEGKNKLADGLAFNIERAMGEHAQKVAQFMSDLYARANKAETAQVQKAATGDRPEVSDNGATVSSAALDTSKLAPFSAESIEARLANLEASGILPRRK
jgi:hypothetical protein